MFSTAAVDELVARASALSGSDLRQLPRAAYSTRRGRFRAYFGLAPRHGPFQRAVAAVEAAGRQDTMTAGTTRLWEALLTSAVRFAGQEGRDTSEVWPAWETWKDLVDAEAGSDKKSVKERLPLQKAVRNGLGRKLYRDFLIANLAAGWALIAIVTWDLASTDDYTVGDRAELTRAWTSVALLPHIGDSG